METIRLHHPIDKNAVSRGPIVMALGFFDGVHRGHQAVIKRARQEASKRNLPLAVMTFDVSPKTIYQEIKPEDINYLTLLEEKQQLMKELGVDIFYVAEMTSAFSVQSPEAFVDNYLVDLDVVVAVAGFDYTYGKCTIANMETLPEYAKGRFSVITVPRQTIDHEKIGSTHIRQQLLAGDVDQAKEALGYPYFFTGRVVNGEHRGRTLGYPTANLSVPENTLIPDVGVYTVECVLNHQVYWGMASVGYNITFNEPQRQTVEIHLFDFNEEIYGEYLKVYWHHFLRGEEKFDSAEALIAQMHNDQANSLAYRDEYNSDMT